MLKEYLSNIANALRQTLGINDKIGAQDFANKIGEVYEKGQQVECDMFWDNFQDYGNRSNYIYAFYNYHWNNEIFKPKHNMKPNTIYYMFYASKILGDLVEILDGLGVEFDTSEATNVSYAFGFTGFTRLGVISTVSANALTDLFRQSLQLHTIDKLILADTGTQTFSNTFRTTSALENITIEGVIGQDIDFSYSPLTSQSMLSIIEHLKDYSNNGGTHTVTFKADRETMLTDEQKALATNKGWSLVWN